MSGRRKGILLIGVPGVRQKYSGPRKIVIAGLLGARKLWLNGGAGEV
jgi:hypothetical protein